MNPQPAAHPSETSNVIPASAYTYRAPSPPFIHVPAQSYSDTEPISMAPSYVNVDSSALQVKDLEIITQNKLQIATDRAFDWSYEQRREAQPIVDFLYLGPNSVVRDHAYLQREGITMLFVTRDARMSGTKLVSIEQAAQKLGLSIHYLDIKGVDHMIGAFQEAIRIINDHLLAIYRSQAQSRSSDGNFVVAPATFRPGKVLVTCESGNERSAAIVAAYIMAVFGKDLGSAIRFVSIQRFCCCYDEETKRKLQSWEDILKARSQVAATAETSRSKRNRQDIESTEDMDTSSAGVMDIDRFEGRSTFAPFLESD